MNIVKATVAALGLAVLAVPAVAQNVSANNLITVQLADVANNLAQNLSVDVQDVIDLGSVQVPVGIAANVCGIDANVLATGTDDAPAGDCTATSTSDALTRIVKRDLAG